MHFYTKEAEPRFYVPMKTRPDDLRPTRTSDAKKEGWVPSVTTILNMLDKPALVNWKVDQHLRQAYKINPAEYSAYDEYLRFVKRITSEEMDKAPTAGTDFHALMEDFVNGDMETDNEMFDFCHNVYWEIESNTGFKNDDGAGHYQTESRFSCPTGFAGMVDLSIADSWVIDYKTKQTKDKFKPGKMAYSDHARQLAAYREGLGLPKARCANVFVCLENGEIDFHEHKEIDLINGWGTFKDCLSIWQRENFNTEFKHD